jgi:CCR4-NOT transcription complex subunit 3
VVPFSNVENSKSADVTASLLETSLLNTTEAADATRSRSYTPLHPYPVPGYYPQTPLSIFSSTLQLFERFENDTLFFAFYHRIGTFQQYLAARELKRQSWRFHKKYQTWFQRFEEPSEVNDAYEQGTYVYFDYEKTWSQKKKDDFR